MKRNLLSILVALLPVVASAFGEIVIGYDAYVDGIYYRLSGDEAEVTFQEYDEYNAVYISNYIGNIVLPASITYNGKTYRVTGIRSYAFADCKKLLSVTIPESVTSIGEEGTFYNCSSLASATIPGSVKNLGSLAFFCCSSLKSVTLEDGVTSIGYRAFGDCSSLTSVNIPKSVTTIGGSAFEGCTALTEVTIPGSVTSIGKGAFKGCSSLTSLTIEDGVKIIGGGAFYGCSIASVTLPASVTSIGSSVFSNCANLTSVTVPESVTSVGAGAFSGTPWYDDQPDGLVYIGKVAYRYKGGMPEGTEISIKEGTVQIAENTFYECVGLTAISIPNSVTNIGPSAFYSCRGLSSVTIPESVTSIGNAAFCGCRGLTSINIPQGVTYINEYTFQNCHALTSVIIPDGVKNIGEHAFAYCRSLTSITIPESVTSIEMKAFYGCSSLTSISIHNGVTSLGTSAFNGCTSLTSVCIPSSVTFIDEYAFCNCTGLTNVFCLAEDVPSTEKNAFNDSPISVATLHVLAGSLEKYKAKAPWSSFGNIVALEQPVTFTAGQVATIILPTEPDASKGMYFRLDRWEEGKIAFEQELQPKAHVPYIILPNEDFSIDLNTLDLAGLRPDTATIEGVYFIGWYINRDLGLRQGYRDLLLDITPDCYNKPDYSIHVGPLRAHFEVSWRYCASWKKIEYVLYSADGTTIITTEEPVTFTKDQMATIILPTAPDAEKGKYYGLDRVEDNQIIFEEEKQPQARTPYIIVPNEDFSIDTSTLDLAGLSPDIVSIAGISFIGTYTSKVLPSLGGDGGGSYYDIIDTTPDCQAEEGKAYTIGALRAYLTVNWDDPISHSGSKGPDDKMGIVLKDKGTGLTPTLSKGEGVIYDLSGRRLSGKPAKGVYINDGKKYIAR